MRKPNKVIHIFLFFIISFVISFILNSSFVFGKTDITLKDSSKYYGYALKGAAAFKYGNIKGTPVIYGYDKKGKFLGYIFLSTDLVDIKSYSGKPLISLISIDKKGIIKGVRVIHIDDPIFLIGIPVSKLYSFTGQYIGKNIRSHIYIGGKGRNHVSAIASASVTTVAMDQTILMAARRFAAKVGIIKPITNVKYELKTYYKPKNWGELRRDGSIKKFVISCSQMGVKDCGGPYETLYYGILSVPNIGKNLLGNYQYGYLSKRWQRRRQAALFMIARGVSSFLGSGFVRGGVFERFHLEQGYSSIIFRDADFNYISYIKIKGAPYFKEGGIFTIPLSKFNPILPFHIVFTFHKHVSHGSMLKRESFQTFYSSYHLPGKYYISSYRYIKKLKPYELAWLNDFHYIIVLGLFLIILTVVFLIKDRIITTKTSANGRKKIKWLYYSVLFLFLVLLGLIKPSQPSITHLYTIYDSLFVSYNPTLFLLDPLIFILFVFIFITSIVWGRGMFCGWICPFGTIQEYIYRIKKRILPEKLAKKISLEFNNKFHFKLVYLKYVIFIILMATAIISIAWGERLAEVEPFKTVFYLHFERQWYFVSYAIILISISALSYRFFCKYMCPLGASFGLLSKLKIFSIKRYEECKSCKICTRSCTIRAIDDKGKINRSECFYCLECQINYNDEKLCPHLLKLKRGNIVENIK
ncbi:MAG: 4Fe-4S binding protein [Candidatus Acidulodesulfobacterium ferriphilum]|uniref:4Fe-4S binding protein n=1 Tax=Candidatus Acidulodesulfobacterium ferriphilum TaxID=2597223 RepID=A0A519BDV5_9DELT|nr:MAG: 4Fe-4S binding protein [Candidatus Acidulodesulfobacterium ferriphilum]